MERQANLKKGLKSLKYGLILMIVPKLVESMRESTIKIYLIIV